MIFKVDTSGASINHRLHKLEDIQRAAKAGLRVGHNRGKPVGVAMILCGLNLVGALQSLVDAAYHVRHAVGRVEALVRIHLSAEIRVGGHLPATEINGF